MEYISNIEVEFRKASFPGGTDCLDCYVWAWKICPKALQGITVGKYSHADVRTEVICSLLLWIWSFQFGLRGAMNDLNILEISSTFPWVLSGLFPPASSTCTIASNEVILNYYITDGIYPPWQIFSKALPDVANQKTKLFNKNVEAVQKSIERVFNVLYRCFEMLFKACELWTVEKRKLVPEAVVVIQKMILEHRCAGYTRDGTAGYSAFIQSEEALTYMVFTENCPGMTPLFSQSSVMVSDAIKVRRQHRDLLLALAKYQCQAFGRIRKFLLKSNKKINYFIKN